MASYLHRASYWRLTSQVGSSLRGQSHFRNPRRLYAAGPPSPPKSLQHREEEHRPRHEVQEKSAAVSVPFNPPGGGGGPGVGGTGSLFPLTSSPLLDAALTTVIGLSIVFLGGAAYLSWYKKRVLDKIEEAFKGGYDPALELVNHSAKQKPAVVEDVDESEYGEASWTENLNRKEQTMIDRIIHGHERGHYYVLLGPKGTGKGTMIFDAMAKCQAEGVSICEAHPDLEVFRLRLGKALNYEFNEDSQTGLFQRRDPREGGPALDIERALNKLEKVALRSARRTGRPLVLIINNIHFFKNDDEGKKMLLQLQQRAEAWAASVREYVLLLERLEVEEFRSDDFWPFNVMRKNASRMHVLSISDLNGQDAFHAAAKMHLNTGRKSATPDQLKEAVSIVGGRLSYLNRVARSRDVVEMADHILDVEKGWLLSQIGLIPDCDDDVMDEQKWSSCSWLLLREFVKIRQEQEKARAEAMAAGIDVGVEELPLPVIPYWRCRQIMTRADFIDQLDHMNVIAIDINHDVRPDSMLVLHAARQVVEEESFEEVLKNVRDRIDEIESLHRTRELTFKDMEEDDTLHLTINKGGKPSGRWFG